MFNVLSSLHACLFVFFFNFYFTSTSHLEKEYETDTVIEDEETTQQRYLES